MPRCQPRAISGRLSLRRSTRCRRGRRRCSATLREGCRIFPRDPAQRSGSRRRRPARRPARAPPPPRPPPRPSRRQLSLRLQSRLPQRHRRLSRPLLLHRHPLRRRRFRPQSSRLAQRRRPRPRRFHLRRLLPRTWQSSRPSPSSRLPLRLWWNRSRSRNRSRSTWRRSPQRHRGLLVSPPLQRLRQMMRLNGQRLSTSPRGRPRSISRRCDHRRQRRNPLHLPHRSRPRRSLLRLRLLPRGPSQRRRAARHRRGRSSSRSRLTRSTSGV